MKSDEFSATTEIPVVPPQPAKIPRTPTTPGQRSILYGIIAAGVMVTAFFWGIVYLMNNSDIKEAQEKSEQVTACSSIQEPNAAFLCVEQVDD